MMIDMLYKSATQGTMP